MLVACLVVLVPILLADMIRWEMVARSRGTATVVVAMTVAASILACIHVVRMREAWRASGEKFTAIFERAGISMWREDWTAAGEAVAALRRAGVLDIEGHFADRPEELRAICGQVMITDVNAFTLEETGAPDKSAYLGPLDRLLPPTDQTFVQWLVAFGRGDRYFRSEAHVTRADGQEMDTLFTAMLPRDPAGFSDILVTSLDITAFKKLQTRLAAAEAELARASRVTTVGAFSASIAHEVNTPLAAVAANAQAALRWLKRAEPDVAEAVAALDDVVSEAVRARDVVARTRSFLGKAPMDLMRIDLVRAARDANLFAERELRATGATVLLTADAEVPPVLGDLVQIQQVFVNLIVNAAQAMAHSPGRRHVSVTVRRQGDRAHVTIGDSGPGIEPAQRSRIFEPFHSTKPGGMGMGLAICRNCIDAHGGDIWADDAPNGGAAFHFTLPIATAAEA
ncbi:sensor histidine kinase [Mangrovicella endophytica]|uniref:sensor histidine kinase n=1 Tax=Mangrovicella endophytica TaxID=2066697 RepID=UPI0018E43319|nr:HAMP domain-containing sensor histidine kinase [Mangrovicella endophytica]